MGKVLSLTCGGGFSSIIIIIYWPWWPTLVYRRTAHMGRQLTAATYVGAAYLTLEPHVNAVFTQYLGRVVLQH